jgi:DNA ligase-1
MQTFAALLDRLVLTPSRNAKLRLLRDYFRDTPDPDRGYALAALTGELDLPSVKPAMLRALVTARVDETLFWYSYDYVGDFAETVALIWPKRGDGALAPPPPAEAPAPPRAKPGDADRDLFGAVGAPHRPRSRGDGEGRSLASNGDAASPRLSEVVERLLAASRTEGPRLVEDWLDQLDAVGRWALIKLVVGGLRIGVSARLAKQALADLAELPVNEIEEVWHAVAPPYTELFAWLTTKAARPQSKVKAPFRPVMLSHAIEDSELAGITPAEYAAEWKWDGIRVQAVREDGVVRLYTRTGDDISHTFPDLTDAFDIEGAIDGELLVGARNDSGFDLKSFGDLQQRLNRKAVSPKLLETHPAFLRAYDCLMDGDEDIRPLPFRERRMRLEQRVSASLSGRIDVSPLLPFADGGELAALRDAPPNPVIEGLMLKRWDSVYQPGRPKGPWFKWKRDPHTVDAVLLYAQRGHGKRSSYYSDYTFGCWAMGEGGVDELVPVGKAYFGFTDEELIALDRYVRNNTVNRFGPVREVVHEPGKGLVLEVAFEGLARSQRHRSGVAMRFPRVARIRWDKPPSEADRLETLQKLVRT